METEKDRVLRELGEYIADLSSLSPIPYDLIDQLTKAEAQITTANEQEWQAEGWAEWWSEVSAKAQRAPQAA